MRRGGGVDPDTSDGMFCEAPSCSRFLFERDGVCIPSHMGDGSSTHSASCLVETGQNFFLVVEECENNL